MTSPETLASIVHDGRKANCKTIDDVHRLVARHAISVANTSAPQGSAEWLHRFDTALAEMSRDAAPLLGIAERTLKPQDAYAEAMRRASSLYTEGSHQWHAEYEQQIARIRGEIAAQARPAPVANIADRRVAQPSSQTEIRSVNIRTAAPRPLAPVVPVTSATPAARGAAVIAALRQLYVAESAQAQRPAAIAAFESAVRGTSQSACVGVIRGASAAEYGAAVDAAAVELARTSRSYLDRVARACGLADEKQGARYRRLMSARIAEPWRPATPWDGQETARTP